MSNTKKGKLGEDIAVKYLQKNGYKILDRNFHFSKYGEIDIVAYKNFKVIAIEVKARTSLFCGDPMEAVTKDKTAKIHKTFSYYLKQVKVPYVSFQIDVISIVFDKDNPELNTIDHLKNIEI